MAEETFIIGIKRHYILNHYIEGLNVSAADDCQFPYQCSETFQCLHISNNYEDYLVHQGIKHGKLLKAMTDPIFEVDYHDEESQLTNVLCHVFKHEILPELNGQCTLSRNIKSPFSTEDLNQCLGQMFFLVDCKDEITTFYDKKSIALKKIGDKNELDLICHKSGFFSPKPSSTICQHHRSFYGKQFQWEFVEKNKRKCHHCHSPTSSKRRVTFEMTTKMNTYFKEFIPFETIICIGRNSCSNKFMQRIKEFEDIESIRVGMEDIDANEFDPTAPSPEPSSSTSETESQQDRHTPIGRDASDDSDDSDYESPMKNDKDGKMAQIRALLDGSSDKKMTLIRLLIEDSVGIARIPQLKDGQKAEELKRWTKHRINNALSSALYPLVEHIAPQNDDKMKILASWMKSGSIEKKLGLEKLAPSLIKDFIMAYNHSPSTERKRIITLLVSQYKYSQLKKFNPPWYKSELNDEELQSSGGDDDDDDDAKMEDEKDTFFNPPLTFEAYRKAEFLYGEFGHPMANPPVETRTNWKIDPLTLDFICDYVMGDQVTQRMAYGTYAMRDDNNKKVYIAKTIREIHNEELIRQLTTLLKENGLSAPSPRTIRRILSQIKATGGKEMRGINSTLEDERDAIVDLAENLKKLEKKLQENNDSSKADIIKLLHKYVPIIGDYLKNHFVYNLRLESEDVNHCVRYTQTYRFIFYLYIFETII